MYRQPPKDENEQEAFPSNAVAGSEFSLGMWGWNMVSYPACNAISGRSTKHWLSKPNVKDDFWEAIFDEPQKLDVMEIQWLYPPHTMKLFFKLDESSDYIPLSEVFEKIEYLSDVGLISNKYNFNPWNTVLFHKPIFAKRIRISMTKPLERYRSFGIIKVKFYQRLSSFLIKNEFINACDNYCFFLNTDKPRENEPIEAMPCIEAIVMGNNQELFTYGVRRDLRYYNDNRFCLGFNGANEIVLKLCNTNNPPFKAAINKDGSFSFIGSTDKCIYVDDSKTGSANFIDVNTEITVTSQADDATYKKENIKLEGQSYWNSVPGDKRVIMQIFFGKITEKSNYKGQYQIKKIDSITIDWVKAPKKFMIYTWKPGYSWVLRFVFTNYSGTKSEISLTGQEASAIMIDMVEGYEDDSTGGLAYYALSNIYIGTNSMKVKTITCTSTNIKYKLFDFEIQSNKKVEVTQEYNKVMKDVSLSFEKLVNIFKNLSGLKVVVPKVKARALDFWGQIKKIKFQVGRDAINKLGKFKSDILGTFSNPAFIQKLENRGEISFINSIRHSSGNIITKPGSMDNPSEDCDQIKAFKPGVKSGFYYIKPPCAVGPLRVFCDFSIDTKPVDIFIFNNYADEPNTDLSYLNLRNPEDFQRACGKIGLQPIQLTKKNMIKRIHQILLAYGYNLSKPMGIPLGFDYTCDSSNRCSHIFNSLNEQQTPPLGFLFEGKAKSVSKGPFVGLGNSSSPLMYTFDITKTQITAVVCSTNSHIGKDSENLELLTCESTADRGDIFEENTSILVRCPKCIESPAKVYGTKIYGANSSICRAAIHSGFASPNGGKFHITKLSKVSTTQGSSDFGVTSLDPIPTNGSFTLKEYKPDCPYSQEESDDSDGEDDSESFLEIENKESMTPQSFLETENKETEANISIFDNKKLQDELKDLDNDTNEIDTISDNLVSESNQHSDFKFKEAGFFNKLKKVGGGAKNLVGGMVNKAKGAVNGLVNKGKGGNTVGDTLSSANDESSTAVNGLSNLISQGQQLANSGMQQVQEFAGEVGNQVNNLLNAGQGGAEAAADFVDTPTSAGGPSAEKEPDPVDPIVRYEESKSSNEQCTPITEYEIKKMESIRKSADFEYLSLVRRKVKSMKKLIAFYLKALSFAKSESKFSINNIGKNYSGLFKMKLQAKNTFSDLKDKALARISRTSKLAKAFNKDLQKFTKLNPFTIDFTLPQDQIFSSIYTIWDAKSPEKSNWAIHKVTINKRFQAAGITSGISTGKQLSASMVTLKYKNYFDFNMTIDVLVKAPGIAGVVFRVIDAFNYYALVFNSPKKFKAIYRVKNGGEKIIQKYEDGGIYIDNWHRVTISANVQSFKITMINLESNGATPQVMHFSDNSFSQGTVGVLVNGMKGFYFDGMKVDPLPCWVPWVPQDGIEIIKPNSSILQEDFRGSIEERMIIINPENENKGPSRWVINNVEKPGVEVGVLQFSQIYDSSSQRKPDMAVYKDKVITNGVLKVTFIGKDSDGTVSIILKHRITIKKGTPTEKFYSFDMTHSENNPKFALRKYIEGTFTEIHSVSKKIDGLPTLGYLPDRKVFVEIQLIVDQISISVSINNSPSVKVMDVKDDSIDYGNVGLGTYKTKAAFTMVELFPPRLKFTDADINYIMQSNLDYIPMPDVKKVYEASKALNIKNILGGVTYIIFVTNNLSSSLGFDFRNDDTLKFTEKSVLWHQCYQARTKEERDNFCLKQYNNSRAVTSCQVSRKYF